MGVARVAWGCVFSASVPILLHTAYMQISPAAVALSSQLVAVKEDRTYSYLLVVLVVVVLVLVIYCFGRWKVCLAPP